MYCIHFKRSACMINDVEQCWALKKMDSVPSKQPGPMLLPLGCKQKLLKTEHWLSEALAQQTLLYNLNLTVSSIKITTK